MKNLKIKRHWVHDYEFNRYSMEYIITDDNQENEYYAHVWNKKIAKIIKKALTNH